MSEEFIPFDLTLTLKELGFCEPCFATYYVGDKNLIPYRGYPNKGDEDTEFSTIVNMDYSEKWVTAPLYQQAFRWFREKYNIDSFVKHLYKDTLKVGYYFGVDKYKGVDFYSEGYETYEEAELACLRKLIELIN